MLKKCIEVHTSWYSFIQIYKIRIDIIVSPKFFFGSNSHLKVKKMAPSSAVIVLISQTSCQHEIFELKLKLNLTLLWNIFLVFDWLCFAYEHLPKEVLSHTSELTFTPWFIDSINLSEQHVIFEKKRKIGRYRFLHFIQ